MRMWAGEKKLSDFKRKGSFRYGLTLKNFNAYIFSLMNDKTIKLCYIEGTNDT